MHDLIVRLRSNHHFSTFDGSFVSERDDAVVEPMSHPTFDLYPPSNDLYRSSQPFDSDREPMDPNRIESSNSKSRSATNHFWNDLETDERRKLDFLIAAMNEVVNGQDAHSQDNLGAGPSSDHDGEEPNVDYEQGADMREKGKFSSCSIQCPFQLPRMFSQFPKEVKTGAFIPNQWVLSGQDITEK